MKQLVILVAGGTGFVGRSVVKALERRGHKVIVHSRSLKAVPTYADVIINLVGIIREDEQSYEDAHINTTKWLVGLGKKLKVQQFVQMSAIGANVEGTPYQKSKAKAEKIVIDSGLPYVIIRPSLIFGPQDKSINAFRGIARTGFFPILTKGTVQPVHVDTVSAMFVAAAERRMKNRTIELGGPEIFTLGQLADRIHPGVRTFPAGFLAPVASFLGNFFTSMPTAEQVKMLRSANTTKDQTVNKLKIKNPRLH
jgi:uncharacterized protein YbjT (DUF2867 family)